MDFLCCNFYLESFTKTLAVQPGNIPLAHLIYGVGTGNKKTCSV